MRTFRAVLTLSVLAVASSLLSFGAEVATHEQAKAVKLQGENGAGLLTIAGTTDGKVAALLGARGYRAPAAGAKTDAEVQVLNADGTVLQKWPLDFPGQSIGAGPDGSIYVAGDGQVARFSATGKLLGKIEVPHIAEVIKDNAKLSELAQAQIKSQSESYELNKKSIADQIKLLRDKVKVVKAGETAKVSAPEKNGIPEANAAPETSAKTEATLTAEEKQQLEELEAYLKMYDENVKQIRSQTVEKVVGELTARLRFINSITATDKDVFIACGELKGYGYSVWRMDPDFKNPTQVMSKLSGCCGQMDVQARDGKLYVAENSRHRVGQYDRDGKPLLSFGKHSREESDGPNFGGCCNPMNCRVCGNGDVYTAESEGIIKKFNAKGEYVSLVGAVKLDGGCKNVAVVASPSGDKLYLCDQIGSKLVILGKRSPEEMKAAAAKQALEDKKTAEETLWTKIVRQLF